MRLFLEPARAAIEPKSALCPSSHALVSLLSPERAFHNSRSFTGKTCALHKERTRRYSRVAMGTETRLPGARRDRKGPPLPTAPERCSPHGGHPSGYRGHPAGYRGQPPAARTACFAPSALPAGRAAGAAPAGPGGAAGRRCGRPRAGVGGRRCRGRGGRCGAAAGRGAAGSDGAGPG